MMDIVGILVIVQQTIQRRVDEYIFRFFPKEVNKIILFVVNIIECTRIVFGDVGGFNVKVKIEVKVKVKVRVKVKVKVSVSVRAKVGILFPCLGGLIRGDFIKIKDRSLLGGCWDKGRIHREV